jgi:hypothetical protein
VALLFTGLWAGGVLVGLPVNWPDAPSFDVVQRHYFSPLFVAALLQLLIAGVAGWWRRTNHDADPFLMLKRVPFVVLVLFLHFNFKAWMPLVNGRLHDGFYEGLDQSCAPLLRGFCALRQLIARHSPCDPDGAYHALFVYMFFVSLSVHALLGTTWRQRQLVLGLCLILLLGGIAYWIAPAEGPFLFRHGLNGASFQAQQHMHALFEQVRRTRQLPPGYFTCPPAAMPSLHIAHALFFTLFAASGPRRVSWLGLLYLPVLLWLVLESVASGWHYLIDLPAGAVLALACLAVARRLVPAPRLPPRP